MLSKVHRRLLEMRNPARMQEPSEHWLSGTFSTFMSGAMTWYGVIKEERKF
jgi:hypothetical protein